MVNSCDWCKDKCNNCIHKGEKEDISDSWEDEEPIMVDVCEQEYSEKCGYEPFGYFCPMCGARTDKKGLMRWR